MQFIVIFEVFGFLFLTLCAFYVSVSHNHIC